MEKYQLLPALFTEPERRSRVGRHFPEKFERQESAQGDLLRESLAAPGRFGEVRRRASDARAIQFEVANGT